MLSLALALARLAQPGPAAAERVAVLGDEVSAAEARVAAVLAARDEVFVSTFIVGDEPFSMTALALLRDAARRGLDVRLLVDAQWNQMPKAVEAHLVAEGVKIRHFHPFRLRHPLWLTKRLHDKLLIVDGRSLVVGGRNIESPYFGFGRQLRRRNYVDLDLLVTGDVARQAREYYLAVWNGRHTAPSHARVPEDDQRAAEAELDRHMAWLRSRIEARVGTAPVIDLRDPTAGTAGTESRPPAAGRAHGQGTRPLPLPAEAPIHAPIQAPVEVPVEVPVETVRFLHDPPRGKGSGAGVGSSLLELLDQARESALLESPYLIPTRELRDGLAAAIARGVHVRIVTNSLATTDNLWAQAGYVGLRERLVAMGIELWEYAGPELIHTKAGVLDGRTVIVGSFNLDPRSAWLNTEVAVALDSEPLAREVGAFLGGHLQHSRRIGARGWPEGADGPFPGVSRGKICRLRMLQLLAPFIRSQL